MIFYNIRQPKEFFSEISKCTGRIDIISSGGNIEELKDASGPLTDEKWNDCDGIINQLELRFHNPEDLVEMLMYITNRRSYGKYSLKVNELEIAS